MKQFLELDSATIKRLIAYLALNGFGLFLIYLLSDFIAPFLGAVIFYVLFKKMMNTMVKKRHWKPSWSALLIILLSFFIILIPIFSFSYLLYSKISEVVNDPSSLVGMIDMLDHRLQELTGVELFSSENIKSLQAKAGNLIPSFLNKFVVMLADIGIMYFIMYYLLINGDTVTKEVKGSLPFQPENIKILTNELEHMTLSNAVGVPLIGIIQGTAAGIGYWTFGLSEPVFWAAITAFASLLPIVGTTLIWFPAAMFLLITGEAWQGLGLAVYGGLVIINIDNIARFVIQKRFADVHPIITVFGVIIGLDLFGLPGLIFGPLMLSYFIIFVKMYRKVYVADLAKKDPD